MLPRTRVELRCNNQSTANTAAAGLVNQLINKNVAVQDSPPVAFLEDAVWQVRADIRFNLQADADAYYAWAAAEIGTAKILTGSRVFTHQCSHDEAVPTPCVIQTITSK